MGKTLKLHGNELPEIAEKILQGMKDYAELAVEMEREGGSKFAAFAWRKVSESLDSEEIRFLAALEYALDAVSVESCEYCEGAVEDDPGGVPYCTECGAEDPDA